MQPYFYPYAGYFRLFACTDLFVVLDDVQFPRRGWVHRNRLLNRAGQPDWLTLPLRKTPRDTTIAQQRFSDNAQATLRARARRFPVLAANTAAAHPVCEGLFDCDRPFVDYLVRQLTAVCGWLNLPTQLTRASSLALDPELKGAERLIAVTRAFDADTYINAPGGAKLYERETFSRAGIALRFLPDFIGNPLSMLERALSEPAAAVRAEIDAQCELQYPG